MSYDATCLPIGFSPNEGIGEVVNRETAAQGPPSFSSTLGSVAKEPATNSPKKQLAGDATDVSAESSDEHLLIQTAKGSKEAVGLLFRRYRRPVLSVARRILRDESEAEDLSQEVFLLIFQKAKSFDPSKGTASSWIIQITYHRAMNRRKFLTHRQHYSSREFVEQQIPRTSKPLIDEMTARNLLNRLREQLSEEQMNALELHFFEGYSLREIADLTGQALGNVRHHFYRGLERLRLNLSTQTDLNERIGTKSAR